MSEYPEDTTEVSGAYVNCDACADAALEADPGSERRVFTYPVRATVYRNPLNGLVYQAWTCPFGHDHDEERLVAS